MTNYNIGLSADKKTVYVTRGGDALPGGATQVLADFNHGAGETTDLVDDNPANHCLYNDVREALYKVGIYDMQRISIVPSGSLVADYLSAADVTRAGAGTITPVIKYQPANVNAVLTDFTFVSSDPTKATVNAATGVITYVAAGITNITATAKDGGKSVTFKATMT